MHEAAVRIAQGDQGEEAARGRGGAVGYDVQQSPLWLQPRDNNALREGGTAPVHQDSQGQAVVLFL